MKLKRTITFHVVGLLAISNFISYAIDRTNSDLSDCSLEIMKYNFSKKYTFTDWMPPLAKNIFNQKSYVEQQYIREKIIQHAFGIAGKIFSLKEDQETIADYLRQIANDGNPIMINPLLAIEDENNPNHQFAINMSMTLYKIVTGQMFVLDSR